MKCVAVYDMFIPEHCFVDAIKDSGLFDEFETYGWKQDQDRAEARNTIRQMETKGSRAFELDPELIAAMQDADVLLTNLVMVPSEVIENAPKLKYICSCRGGLENIDMDAAKKRGIPVFHAPAHNAVGVAEMCIGHMICESRNIARSNDALKSGKWREQYPNSARIQEMRSLTVGIIGFGTIGRLVANYLKAFGSRVIVQDPFVPADDVRAAGCEPVSKDELLAQADIITLHGRIGPNDPPIIGREELEKMKPTAYLVNTARAVLVDMEALEEALEQHKIMGAALDVFPHEPLTADDKITQLDNVTITSHRGGTTVESFERAPELVLSYLKEFVETGKGRSVVM